MTVRCILIATFVILQLSNIVKCSDNLENVDEKQTFLNVNNKYQTFPRTFSDDIRKDLKTFQDESEIKDTDADDFKPRIFVRGCGNSLCEFFKNHRVIRQAGYSTMYPQVPTSYPYRQPNNTYQYNARQPINPYGNNSYPSYSKPVVPIIPYQNPAINDPVYNSSYSHFPNKNISNNNYQNSRHTYPPSPRPPNRQPLPYYGGNTTSVGLNTSYPFNINRPTNSFGNAHKQGYPNPGSNLTNYNIYNNRTQGGNRYPNNTYLQPRPLPSGQLINNSRPNYNGFHTYPTSNFNTTFNGYQSPNGSHYNGKSTYYDPQRNFTYRPPVTPNYQNYGGNNSLGSNKNNFHIPFAGNKVYPTYNNNTNPYNFNQTVRMDPYQRTSTNRPQTTYSANIPQYNAAMEPNHFYYVPNNNGSQYDSRRHPPERFSY
ncbi:hypothetical protein RR48_09224 [Papilio machaon]|uniref:Uncharacterized protein n=1 Tax=Papilio machaon TaxID=76193 RepID=A0A194RC67_PAPMA|nr:hypothetical protein RR48_09224 [Papilio machaon]